jgi:hypothetical protein
MDQNSPRKWFNLEEQFFKNLDNQLLERLRSQSDVQQSAQSIMKVTGIQNEAVATKLAALDITVETLAAFNLVPLVAVAWANDSVDSDEKYVVQQAAQAAKLDEGSLSLLGAWLERRPGPELMDAWCDYTRALVANLNEPERLTLREHVLEKATAVARSSGGLLGLGAVSGNERATLERIQAALG